MLPENSLEPFSTSLIAYVSMPMFFLLICYCSKLMQVVRREKKDDAIPHPTGGYKSFISRRLRATAGGGHSQWSVMLLLCILVIAGFTAVRRSFGVDGGDRSRSTRPTSSGGPPLSGLNSHSDKYTNADAERAAAAYQTSVEYRKAVEITAMRKDHLITELYKRKGNMTAAAFESILAATRQEVRAAEDAVDKARATELERRRLKEKIVRSVRESRALEELGTFLTWANTRFQGYGRSDVCRHPEAGDHDVDAEGSLLMSTGSSANGPKHSIVKDCVPEAPFLHSKPDLVVSDISGLLPIDAAVTCELMILGVDVCDNSMGTYVDCVLWYGTEAWTIALQPQCATSQFWARATKELLRVYGVAATIGVMRFRKGGRIASHNASWVTKNVILDKITNGAVVRRTPVSVAKQWGSVEATSYGPPLVCRASGSDQHVYPFSYGITSGYFSRHVTRRKLMDWYPILPGFKPLSSGVLLPPGVPYRLSYSLSIIDEYLNTLLMRFSKFAWTHIRGGPDSMRHYEILSQGTAPYFLDLDACMYKPCLAQLPKALLRDVTKLPGVKHLLTVSDAESTVMTPHYFRYSRKEIEARRGDFTHVVNFVARGDVNADELDEDEYYKLTAELLETSRATLSCASVVKSLFVRSGFAALDSLPRSVLFVSFPHTDYITYTLECGLGELGMNYTVNYRYGTRYKDEDEAMMRPMHRNPDFTFARATGGLLVREVLRRKSTKDYGFGFATSQKLQMPPNPIPANQEALCQQLLSGWHDFYVIAWKSHAFLLDSCFETAMDVLGPNRVVIVDGEDQEYAPNLTRYTLRGVRVFSREARCELFE